MKVAIAFIGTSNYLNFLPHYYEKIHENFLPDTEKTFLVFTDGEGEFPEDVKLYSQEHLEWPYITLTRFEILNKAREKIAEHDWLVFLDADTLVVDKVLEEDFFSDKSLFGVWHPCHNLGMPPHNKVPGAFETNPLSLASFNFEIEEYPTYYYQGCLWGGKVPEVLKMIDELENRVKKDLEKNVIAVWHDESHLNKYFVEHRDQVNTLHPEYAYPEVFADYCDFEPKIVHLAKDNSKYQT